MTFSLHSFFIPVLLTSLFFISFFFNDTATTEIYTLSLHDALPISSSDAMSATSVLTASARPPISRATARPFASRSEEHTSELQSRPHLVCRLLLEKKKKISKTDVDLQLLMISLSLVAVAQPQGVIV